MSSALGWPDRPPAVAPHAGLGAASDLGWPADRDGAASQTGPAGYAGPRPAAGGSGNQPGGIRGEDEAGRRIHRALSAEGVSRETRRNPSPRPDSVSRETSARRVITVANQKGGVGKTTSAVNLAAALAGAGVPTLVIDMDPQGNASTALGVDHQPGIDSIYDVLIEGRPLAEVVVASKEVPNLSCVPATIDLAGAEIELVSMVARESRLARALAGYPEAPDLVFVDCPPSLGLLTVNALVAAGEVLIPIQCEYYALEGLSQLVSNIDLVRGHLNAGLRISTILLTMYDARTRLAEQVAAEVREHFGARVLDSVIPRSVRVSEAPGYGQTVVTYDPDSRGARSYRAAADELTGRPAAGRATAGNGEVR